MIPCPNCGFTPHAPGVTWGHLNNGDGWQPCEHQTNHKRCDSCSTPWWAPGFTDTHDFEYVDGEHSGGPEEKDCPECELAYALECVGAPKEVTNG